MSDGGGVRWLDDDEAAAWRAFVRSMHRVSAAVSRDLARDHGLSDPEYAVLVSLSEAPGHTVRMGVLAAELDWSRSRLSHLLTRMEGRGLVRRADCSSDGRGAFAQLTAAGMAEITAAAPGHVASVRRHFVDRLDRDQLRVLATTLGALLAQSEPCGSEDAEEVDGCSAGAGRDDGSDGIEECEGGGHGAERAPEGADRRPPT